MTQQQIFELLELRQHEKFTSEEIAKILNQSIQVVIRKLSCLVKFGKIIITHQVVDKHYCTYYQYKK